MAIRLVCRSCGKRLKVADDAPPRGVVRCPKCRAKIDLALANEAAAYTATVPIPSLTATKPPTGVPAKPPPPPAAARPAARIGEDDPLPYPVKTTAPAKTGPAPPAPKPPAPALPPGVKSLVPDSDDDPLPYPAASAPRPGATPKPPGGAARPAPAQAPLSLDDDTEPGDAAPELTPFRVPVRVLADSLKQVAGPCFAVIVPHGVFLEREPMRPFLYFPVGCAIDSPAAGDLTVTLPDRRAVTFRFGGRSGRALARDAGAFLAGRRPAPAAADYRRKWWMLGPAVIFALGLASGPLVLSQTAELGLDFGLKVGAGFALAGLVANLLVALFSRRSVFVQMLAMAGVCLLVSGVFFFGATAYLAGRQRAEEEAKEAPPAAAPAEPNPAPPAAPPVAPPDPRPERPPSHLDRARKNGSSALDDGPADVTALQLAPDGNTLGIGYADGTARLWPLDQPTIDPIKPGPKADGPVLRVQFDRKGQFVFAHAATGVVAVPRAGPPPVEAKIPGAPVAVAPDLADDRLRFAAVRGNAVQLRQLPTDFIRNPPVKGKAGAYAIPTGTDEVGPKGKRSDPAKPPGPTFLAWAAGDRLLAGQPGGTVSVWGAAARPDAPLRPEPAVSVHKAAVRVWAECPGTGALATGDDKGTVALWPPGGGKPTPWPVFDGVPVAGLSFNPAGSRLAVADNTGWLVVWDVAAGKAVHRVKRPAPVRAVACGPNDSVMILAAGRTVEVWWLPELIK